MSRKKKLERAQPSASRSPAAANKYGRWRAAVVELLSAEWHSSANVESVAATVVGMFDAGANDAEVADFLHSQELLYDKEASLTDAARMALVQALHKSAGAETSIRPSNEEL
jgi:hypothetical protein